LLPPSLAELRRTSRRCAPRNDVALSRCKSAFSRRHPPEACKNLPPQKKRAQGMPGARCTRGLVRKRWKEAHTSIQVQRKQSDIPCAMALRLIPCSPRRRIRLVTVAAGLMAGRSGRIEFAADSLAPATGVGTTRFCRTQQPVFAPPPSSEIGLRRVGFAGQGAVRLAHRAPLTDR
jgi:hypothetical protein